MLAPLALLAACLAALGDAQCLLLTHYFIRIQLCCNILFLGTWLFGDWSACSSTCGTGTQSHAATGCMYGMYTYQTTLLCTVNGCVGPSTVSQTCSIGLFGALPISRLQFSHPQAHCTTGRHGASGVHAAQAAVLALRLVSARARAPAARIALALVRKPKHALKVPCKPSNEFSFHWSQVHRTPPLPGPHGAHVLAAERVH